MSMGDDYEKAADRGGFGVSRIRLYANGVTG